MTADDRVLVDYLERITEDKIIVFKLELEHTLVLAQNCDETHVLILIWCVSDPMNETIWHIVVLCLHRVPDVVGLKVQPIAA